MGYYDPYPLIYLDQPLCLIGFMGSDVHSVAYFLSSLSGVPFVELDKLVEHEVGMSLAQLYLEEGEARWRQLELKHLERALKMRPARIICLGDGTLLNDHAARLCAESSTLVYLRRPQQTLYTRVVQKRKESPQRFPLWVRQEPMNISELLPLLSTREPSYERADLLIDIGEMGGLESAQRLAKRLNWF